MSARTPLTASKYTERGIRWDVREADGPKVATIAGPPSTRQARAHLFAAAPDLLAADEKAARVLDSAAIALAGHPTYRALVKRCEDMATELRTATAKARGGA